MKFLCSSLLCVLSSCCITPGCAFAFLQTFGTSRTTGVRFVSSNNDLVRSGTSTLFMSDDFPSDSSVEALLYDTEATPYTGSESETLVNSIRNELPDSLVSGAGLSKDARAKINEALLNLEAMNPTKNPTSSPLINGVWSLRYAAGYSPEWALPSPTRDLALFLYSGGYSPGLFALSVAQKLPAALVEVGDLEIIISRNQPRIVAIVNLKFLGGQSKSEVSVTANLEVKSTMRFSEVYESASAFGRKIEIPSQLKYSRELFVTYVDEDMLIVRDASGIPEVLVRKEKIFKGNWGTEPSDVEEMKGPGES
eukprot:CAMPEP_0172414706 /NCGR_PEP_ID=MMETSP1064-20121228/1344_1 /TAXON_ID=202472 /ORGANISM="Aulacoseira subarctica , Strain CCAP 1002/5" /LENGTH=308 /DNA_ID=CAMNT_0013151501 /DNA_START=41 /DNA_END=967 /DNA_ORIENTATION=+